jgi:hypothetical protein
MAFETLIQTPFFTGMSFLAPFLLQIGCKRVDAASRHSNTLHLLRNIVFGKLPGPTRITLLVRCDVLGEIVLESDQYPRPVCALVRHPGRWRRFVWRTTRRVVRFPGHWRGAVWRTTRCVVRFPGYWRRVVRRAARRGGSLHRMPAQLQHFFITKPAVEEFVKQLRVTRTRDHARPCQLTARSHSKQSPRTHSTPPLRVLCLSIPLCRTTSLHQCSCDGTVACAVSPCGGGASPTGLAPLPTLRRAARTAALPRRAAVCCER